MTGKSLASVFQLLIFCVSRSVNAFVAFIIPYSLMRSVNIINYLLRNNASMQLLIVRSGIIWESFLNGFITFQYFLSYSLCSLTLYAIFLYFVVFFISLYIKMYKSLVCFCMRTQCAYDYRFLQSLSDIDFTSSNVYDAITFLCVY